jgi:hypothetical protein
MNDVQRGKLQMLMLDFMMKQANVRVIRLEEFHADPQGAGAHESKLAYDLLNKVEQQLALVINNLSKITGMTLHGDRKAAARTFAGEDDVDKQHHSVDGDDIERALGVLGDKDAPEDVIAAALLILENGK